MNKITRLANVQLRALAENERKVEGIACVFDTETDLGWFYESIDRNAFDNCDMSDVYCLFNHDENYPLARTLNGSLELSVEDKGLHQVTNVIDTSQGNDIFKMVRENLIDKMSFAFTIDRDHGEEWWTDEEGKEHRNIKKIDKLYDVSLVTYPAYSSTSAFARSVGELDELAQKHLEVRQMETNEQVVEVVEREEEHVEVVEEVHEEAHEETTSETTDVVEEVVEETTQEAEEALEATEEVADVQMEERNMNTNFEKVEARAEDIQAWRKSVMSSMVEERAGVKSTDTGVPVPTTFQSYVERAWAKIDLLDEVTKSTIKGIFKVSYESSADPAHYHAEGADAPNEEALTLATITLIPMMVKKWISVTDELEAMTDDEFMKYIAEEVVYQVLKFVQAKILVGAGQGTGSNEGIVGITNATLTESLTEALSFNIGNEALALVDGGASPLAVMNRKTFFHNIMGLKTTTGAPVYQIAMDNTGKPQYFVNGIRVKFNDALPAYDSANAGDAYVIVGDFNAYRLNMPAGQDVATLFDPYTLATQDKARMIGKLFCAGNVTRPKALAKIVKPAA